MGQSGSASAVQNMGPPQSEEKAAWWCRMLARGIAIIGGLVAMVTGVISLITFTPLCLVSGILLINYTRPPFEMGLMTDSLIGHPIVPLRRVAYLGIRLLGFLVVLLEAPCCCSFLDFIQPITRFSENRPYYQKALMFGIPAVLPVALCFTLTTLFGAGLIFASAVFYMMMSVGNKADRDTMAKRVRGDDMEMKSELINSSDQTNTQ